MTDFDVIALSGRAGVGKDWIYEHYLKPLGYRNFALATHFKIFLIGQKKASYDEVFTSKPPNVRKLLQEEGTERGRNVYGDEIWLDTAYAWMLHFSAIWGIKKFCITDVRFPNEADYIKARQGKVIRINAPIREAKNGLTAEARRHPSETALDDYKNFDLIVQNDPKYQETVRKQICDFLGCVPIEEDAAGLVDEMWEQMDKTWDSFDKVFDKFEKLNKKIFGGDK